MIASCPVILASVTQKDATRALTLPRGLPCREGEARWSVSGRMESTLD